MRFSFTPQETFDTTHNFTWISTRQSLAQRRQHSVSAWYPFDRYTVSTTVEAFDLDSFALPIEFVHMYAGLSGYELRIDSVENVKTAQSDEALYITFSIQVSRTLSPPISTYPAYVADWDAVAALQGCQGLCSYSFPHQLYPRGGDGLGCRVRVLRPSAP